MRDVGILVWVVLVVIGVISSIASSVRRGVRTAQTAPARPPGQFRPPPRQPQIAVSPVPAPRPAPSRPPPPPPPKQPAPAAHPVAAAHHTPRRIFVGKSELARAIIAAEVLGKPRALRDEHFTG